MNKNPKNFTNYANLVTNVVSGATTVPFCFLEEDSGYCETLKSLFNRQCPTQEAWDILTEYVNSNF